MKASLGLCGRLIVFLSRKSIEDAQRRPSRAAPHSAPSLGAAALSPSHFKRQNSELVTARFIAAADGGQIINSHIAHCTGFRYTVIDRVDGIGRWGRLGARLTFPPTRERYRRRETWVPTREPQPWICPLECESAGSAVRGTRSQTCLATPGPCPRCLGGRGESCDAGCVGGAVLLLRPWTPVRGRRGCRERGQDETPVRLSLDQV